MLSDVLCRELKYYNPVAVGNKQKKLRLLLEVPTSVVSGSEAKAFCHLAAFSCPHRLLLLCW